MPDNGRVRRPDPLAFEKSRLEQAVAIFPSAFKLLAFGDDPLGFDLDNTSSFWRGFAKPGGKVEAEDRGSVRRCEGWPDPRDPENAAGYRAGARNKRCVE